jgi:teichuronic acid biosynthesis glycosyltransferase TuaG
MLQPPIVSIIIPAYNSEATITQTIDSVLSQTLEDWEMIVVDDFSSDNTRNILYGYARKDSRLTILENSSNCGVSASRNRAIATSRGRFIAFLDSDDYWDQFKLENQLHFMLARNIAFSYHDYFIVNNAGLVVKRVFCPSEFSYRQYLSNNQIGVLTIMIDTHQVGKPHMFNQPVAATVATWLTILRDGNKAYCAPNSLGYYRITKRSLSRNKLRSRYWYWRALVDILRINPIVAIYYVLVSSVFAAKKNFCFPR